MAKSSFRSKVARNIIDNTPAGDWSLATKKEKRRLGVSLAQPYYIRKIDRERGVRKRTIHITRDAFTVKKYGLDRRKLAEARAKEGGAAHPRHGYKRPLTAKMRELLNKRRRLKLIRESRRSFNRRGNTIAAAAQYTRLGRPRSWSGFKQQLDQAIGPDTAETVASREMGSGKTRIEDGNWHSMIDTMKGLEGEDSPLVKLLRSSGRYHEDGVWVTDQG